MKKILKGCMTAMLLLTGSLPGLLYAQQARYSPEVEDRIIRVENGLAGWLQTGKGDTWSLYGRMKKYNVKGVSIAVIHDYKIEWAKGYGFADVSEKRRVTDKTLFQAASISKSLNSVGVLRLVQDGKLDLNTDINKYLASWKFPYDSKTGKNFITLRQLLSHTAGLTVHGFPGYEQGTIIPSIADILDGKDPANTKPVRSYTEPGREYSYSGGGTTVAQMIVMDVTKQPYADFMQKNVLSPLGMKSSSYQQPPRAEIRLLATGYKADGSEVKGKFHIYPEQAAAGLWTNPTDLCRYIIETQLAFKGESSVILSPELTRLRVTPVMQDAGLGTFINSRVTGSSKYFNHNGGNEGFSCTSVGSLSEGNGVVVMINSDNSAILEEIVNSVASVYKWKDYYLPLKIRPVDVSEGKLVKYEGKYDLDGTTGTIRKTPEGLVINADGADTWRLYFTTDSDFRIREVKGAFRFSSGKDGKVNGILFNEILFKKL